MVWQFSIHPRHVERYGKLQNHSKIAPGGLWRRVCKSVMKSHCITLWMDGWMVTLVHGFPLSRDSSKATLRPRCHKTLLPAVLFQGNIPSTVAVVYVKDTVQCHRSEPYSTLQYSWCTLFAKGLNLSVLIFT